MAAWYSDVPYEHRHIGPKPAEHTQIGLAVQANRSNQVCKTVQKLK